jgi:hypothetical protein
MTKRCLERSLGLMIHFRGMMEDNELLTEMDANSVNAMFNCSFKAGDMAENAMNYIKNYFKCNMCLLERVDVDENGNEIVEEDEVNGD